MSAYLELWRASGVERTVLEGDRITVGADPSNGVCIDGDDTVSRLHAVLSDYGSGWTVRDLGSRNGTRLNGEPVLAERALRPGDELRIGKTRVVFKTFETPGVKRTLGLAAEVAPELTRRERDVLRALCRPLASSDPFRQPASIRGDRCGVVRHRGRRQAASPPPLRQVRPARPVREPPRAPGQRGDPACGDHRVRAPPRRRQQLADHGDSAVMAGSSARCPIRDRSPTRQRR